MNKFLPPCVVFASLVSLGCTRYGQDMVQMKDNIVTGAKAISDTATGNEALSAPQANMARESINLNIAVVTDKHWFNDFSRSDIPAVNLSIKTINSGVDEIYVTQNRATEFHALKRQKDIADSGQALVDAMNAQIQDQDRMIDLIKTFAKLAILALGAATSAEQDDVLKTNSAVQVISLATLPAQISAANVDAVRAGLKLSFDRITELRKWLTVVQSGLSAFDLVAVQGNDADRKAAVKAVLIDLSKKSGIEQTDALIGISDELAVVIVHFLSADDLKSLGKNGTVALVERTIGAIVDGALDAFQIWDEMRSAVQYSDVLLK